MTKWEPAVWELLFSFVFVLVGSATFHISSLISGTSIFREYSPQFSTLMALTIGIVLFGISPISFLLLGPFLEEIIKSGSGQVEGLRLAISVILTRETILPFILSAAGFGLLSGALVTLQARIMCLKWIRKKTNMQFGIKSYQLSWDSYLSSIKRDGTVCIEIENRHIEGRLTHFSIRNEPQAIWLSNYTSYANDIFKGLHHKPVDGEILIRGEEIRRVSAPDYSFNKHHDSMRHISQAFYMLLVAVGFFMLAVSMDGTATFLSKPRYLDTLSSIQETYSVGALLLLLVAFVMLLIALRVLKKDCLTWEATKDLYPEFITAIIVIANGFAVYGFLMLTWRFEVLRPYLYEVIAVIVIYTIAAWYYFHRRSKIIKGLFTSIRLEEEPGIRPSLKELVDEIYIKMDPNKPEDYPNTIIPRNIDKQYENHYAVPKIEELLNCLFEKRQYLRHEIYNIIVMLRIHLQQKQDLELAKKPGQRGNI